MTLENIDSRIDALNSRIKEIEGRPTEVYSRIVGYYRSVKNWNNGKSAEYKVRKTFMEPELVPCQPPVLNVEAKEKAPVAIQEEAVSTGTVEAAAAKAPEAPADDNQADLFAMDETPEAPASSGNEVGSYSFFFRNTCPNCPPVKELISQLAWDGTHINVDEEEGLNAAVEHNVFTAPTVIVFSPEGSEIFRTDNVTGLREFAEAEIQAVTAV